MQRLMFMTFLRRDDRNFVRDGGSESMGPALRTAVIIGNPECHSFRYCI
jgi:hypothetical protein